MLPSDVWHWVNDPQFPSFNLVFARSKSTESVLGAYGADVKSAAVMTHRESLAQFPRREVEVLLRIGTFGDWTFCYEDRKLLGITKDVRISLSRESETIGLFKGGDGMRSFERMQDCRRIELFEPHRPSEVHGEGPFVFADLVSGKLSGAGPDTLGMSALTLVLAERLGLILDRDVLEGPLLTAPLGETGPPRGRPRSA
ncbi:DUF6461 domain-containing protein [Streptomyces sp. NPDC020707]|uniref:DUF6461 domain-containing protein n=1 Tax=Streptomyces sp. NPDC020707 TaxID=3365084 RepID=UPI00379183E0